MTKRKTSISVSVDIETLEMIEELRLSPTVIFQAGLDSMKVKKESKKE